MPSIKDGKGILNLSYQHQAIGSSFLEYAVHLMILLLSGLCLGKWHGVLEYSRKKTRKLGLVLGLERQAEL